MNYHAHKLFALSCYGEKSKNLVLWLWPWYSIGC